MDGRQQDNTYVQDVRYQGNAYVQDVRQLDNAGAVVEELLPKSSTPVDSTDLFRIMMPAERGR